jgi:RNA-directed DNA polymerase
VISPVFSKSLYAYAFDKWMEKKFPANQWVRYADDGIVHCRTKEEAEYIAREYKEKNA